MRSVRFYDYLMGRQNNYVLPKEVVDNADSLLDKVNDLLESLPPNITLDIHPVNKSLVSSGWRPPEINSATPGAAPKSKHMTGHAVDIYDPDGDIDDFLTDEILEKFGLYREHPSQTKSWVHLQDVPPRSGKRTFYA